MVTDALRLDPDTLAAFIETERPDYLATETWVRGHATALQPETIVELNERILAAKFNDLDDWLTLHQQLKAVVRV
jgi:hypothetical protein